MAMSESRKRKLDMLLRTLAQKDVVRAEELLGSRGHSGVNRGRAGAGANATAEATGRAPAGPVSLVDACGGEAATIRIGAAAWPGDAKTDGGGADEAGGAATCEYHLIRRTLAEIAPRSTAIEAEYAAVMKGARQRFDDDAALSASPELCRLADLRGEDLLFMDTETCGLSGSMIFLVGVMWYEGGRLVLEQCFAKDYSQEPAVLQAFMDRYDAAGLLVTFNGKAFDMNLIAERAAFHGIELPPRPAPHLDLLHESRRRWKADVPNCKLQTLERLLCGRRRVGDIPGAEIPAAYHNFVATGDARQIADILHHNLLDLLTMAQLVSALMTGAGPLAC